MTKTTTIDLMRHGEVEGGHRFRGSTDDPVSKLGWQQMQQALEAGNDWTQIISSPLQRCAKFAKFWSDKKQLHYSTDKNFQEMHFGDWEGKTAEEISEQDPDALINFWQDPDQFAPDNSEPLSDFKNRILNAWQDLIEKQTGQHVLLITHGGAIRIIIAHILEIPEHALLRLDIPLAGISRIKIYHTQGEADHCSLIFHAGTL